MPTIQVYLDVKVDGVRQNQFPVYRSYTVDEVQTFDYTEANDGDNTTFSAVPLNQVDSVQNLIVQALDQAIGLRVEGSESSSVAIRLSATGLVAIFDATITNTNITVNNNSGSDARIAGLGAGT